MLRYLSEDLSRLKEIRGFLINSETLFYYCLIILILQSLISKRLELKKSIKRSLLNLEQAWGRGDPLFLAVDFFAPVGVAGADG